MEKRISYRDFQSVKSIAKAIDPKVREKESIKKKLEALALDYKKCDDHIKLLEAGVLQTIGFHVTDLVKKVIETNTDANGKITKTAKYLPTDMVTYDDVNKQYVITAPDEPSTTEETPQEPADNVSEETTDTPSTSDFESVFD